MDAGVKAPVANPKTRRARLVESMPWIRIGLMVFALAAVAALTVDLVSLRMRAARAVGADAAIASEALIEVATATNAWIAPDGSFSLRVPRDWTVALEPADGATSVTLRGPHRMELRVVSRAAPEGGIDALRAELETIEQGLSLRTALTGVVHRGGAAWQRSMRLPSGVVETLDFVEGARMYHIVIGAPGGAFDLLRPALVELRDRVTPLPGGPP